MPAASCHFCAPCFVRRGYRRPTATAAIHCGGALTRQLERLGPENADGICRLERCAFGNALHRCGRSVRTTSHRVGTYNDAATGTHAARDHRTRKTQLLADEVTTSSTPHTHLNLHLVIERNSKFVRGMSKARRWIEDFCHSLYEMRCVNRQRTRYEITMPFAHGAELEAAIEELLGEIHFTAEMCNCMAEAVLHDPVADRYWR